MKYIKNKLTFLISLGLLVGFASCKEDVTIDTGKDLNNLNTTTGNVRNVASSKDLATIHIFGTATGTGQVYYEVPKSVSNDTNVEFELSSTKLEDFNKKNGTNYEMYPANLVSFSNSGIGKITANERKSEVVTMTVNSGGNIGTTYAIPVSVKSTESNTTPGYYIYLIKPQAAIPSSDKGTGMKTIVYMEVNDENILNVGEYTMKKTGKPFVDVVNIFAANINFNASKNQVYLNCNDNVAYVLENADQIIRPLQAKGIKVCLTVLGNHDEAGIANLSAEAAKGFAAELKSYVDLYGLDGVDFDDEYSNYNEMNPSAGFVKPSGEAVARLVAECRKAMPDKIISVYDFHDYYPTGSVDGTPVGELLDYSYWGAYYGDFSDRSGDIDGLGIKKYGPVSFNMDFSAGGSGFDLELFRQVRRDGYGIQMLYNLKPLNYDYSKVMDDMGQILYDDNVVWSGKTFGKKDLTSSYFKPSYESYLGSWTLKTNLGVYWYAEGNYFQWGDGFENELTIEKDVEGKTFKVYGWGETRNNLPLIMNYTEHGRISINLPQTVADPKGEKWTYVARYGYYIGSSDFVSDYMTPAFTGYLNAEGSFVIRAFKDKYFDVFAMSPIQYSGGPTMDAIYGGWYQDVLYAPYTLTKK